MILSIKTETFKDLLDKALKGVSNNKLFPITSLVGIQFADGELTVMTYDGNNSIYLFHYLGEEEGQKQVYVAVEANKLHDLIGKITDETIQLIFGEDSFNVKSSNGTFKFSVAVEDGFGVVKFPDNQTPLLQEEGIKYIELYYKDLELLLKVNRAAAAKTSEVICLTGAYIGEKIITTDSYVACITDKDLFNETMLLNYTTIDLLPIFENDEKVVAVIGKDRISFYTDNAIVVGSKMSQLNDFPGKEIMSFLELQFTNQCLVKKSEILDALDRLNIFITPFDKNIMELSFTENSLTIKSLNSNAVESIPIKNGANLVCKTGFSGLKNEISSVVDETFTLKFGNDIALAVVDSIATHIISLAEE